MLSVIIITCNEQRNIRDCLQSVSWADEIVVVDSGSTDDTLSIAREFTDRVIESGWSGFGPQKNKALAAASGDWVLSLDADERISDLLRQEILSAMASATTEQCYEIPRSSQYCGRMMRYGGWYPDYVLRLFRRESASFSTDPVHERVLCATPPARLKHPIQHFPVETLDSSLAKMNLYSTLAAQQKFDLGQRSNLFEAVFRGFWSFFRTFILKLGFLDGQRGFLLAIANGEGTYYKYAKLTMLAKQNSR